MSNTITGKRRSSWDRFHTDGKIKVIRSTGVLGTAYSGTGYTVPSGQVLLIDKVQISAHWDSADASTTNYVQLRLNGSFGSNYDNARFIFGNNTGEGRVVPLVWEPRGKFVLFPGDNIQARQQGTAMTSSLTIIGRQMSYMQAIESKYITGTEFLTATSPSLPGLGVPQIQKTVVADKCVEINSTCSTAFSALGSTDFVQIAFDVATVDDGYPIMAASSFSPSPTFDGKVIANECLIQGPAGYGISAISVNTGANQCIINTGRMIDPSENYQYEPTGQTHTDAAQSVTRDHASTFWFCVNATPIGSAVPIDPGPIALSTKKVCFNPSLASKLAVVRVFQASMSGSATSAIGVAADGAGAALSVPLYGIMGASGAVSNMVATNINLPTYIGTKDGAANPGLDIATGAGGGYVGGAFTVWGTIHPDTDTGTSYITRTYFIF